VKKLVAVGNTESIAAIEQFVKSRRLSQYAAFSLMHAHLNRLVQPTSVICNFEICPVSLYTSLLTPNIVMFTQS